MAMCGAQVIRASEVQAKVVDARALARIEAARACGRGFYGSRGAWIVIPSKSGGEAIVGDGHWEWGRGSEKLLQQALDRARYEPDAAGVYIEGGWNFAAAMSEFSDGAYDPLVSEWSVEVWNKEA